MMVSSRLACAKETDEGFGGLKEGIILFDIVKNETICVFTCRPV